MPLRRLQVERQVVREADELAKAYWAVRHLLPPAAPAWIARFNQVEAAAAPPGAARSHRCTLAPGRPCTPLPVLPGCAPRRHLHASPALPA